jgi:chromate transport protein ChrA
MKLPDKVYDILKWVCLIASPAIIAFLTTIFTLYKIPGVEVVTGTIAAVATLIGALIGISSVNYSKKDKDDNATLRDMEKEA